MSVETTVKYASPSTNRLADWSQGKSLFSPIIDFLCLGGGFFVLFLPIVWFFPKDDQTIATISVAFLLAANFINHPHFAHSYQIFYRDFGWKAFSDASPLREKYLFAGVGVPAIIFTFFGYCLMTGDYLLLGFTGNVMAFLVGWHYTKQGYGMLMVTAVLKRNFFNETEKRILLINAYAVWGFSWVKTNQLVADKSLWGIEYFAFSLPDWALWLTATPLALSSLLTALIFFRSMKLDFAAFPKNGAVAYITSLYIWLILAHIHPVLIFIIPAFHSLQYLIVIWRYEINKSKSDYQADIAAAVENPPGIKRRLIVFGLAGLVFGAIGFWLAPIYLDSLISYAKADLSNTAFVFMFWIFINIHHYFIDNVIWKKENTDVAKHLFG